MDLKFIILCSLFCIVWTEAVVQNKSETKEMLSVPLIDQLKATLTADINVSELNKGLREFIVKTIRVEVDSTIKQSVTDLVKSQIQQEVNGKILFCNVVY